MAKPKKKPAAEPKWMTVEKVVALLETTLAPDARVRHNVALTCLTTGHKEQCDVVIETGQEPRIFRTIVEVQKRTSRVKPNEFRGWCQKLRDVGANRLICVSALPFPRSIKDKVTKELGPTVMLVRLESLETQRWPFQIVDNAMRAFIPDVKVNAAIKPNPLFIFHPDKNPFREYADGKLVHMNSETVGVIQRGESPDLRPMKVLLDEGARLFNDHPDFRRLPVGTHEVSLTWHPRETSLCFDGRTAPIQKVRVNYSITIRAVQIPVEISGSSDQSVFRFMECQDFEFEELGVSEAVGLSLEGADLVVDAFQRAG